MTTRKAIRGPTEDEVRRLLPACARGWENQEEEFEFWFAADEAGAATGAAKGWIEGKLPDGLKGTFLRNGPGVTEVYGTPLKHPIDGDGMVCALSFSNGGVHFRSRYVRSRSHEDEKRARRMLYPGQMGSRPPKGGGKPKKAWRDPSHTNVFYWGGKLLTCHEYALPHALHPGSLETVGRDGLNGTLDLRTLSDPRPSGGYFRPLWTDPLAVAREGERVPAHN
ncbi:Apocarotenoid-15 [Diplonema papillatum]|nr:Apocarotenoid-15 [Diplonema papillatum]